MKTSIFQYIFWITAGLMVYTWIFYPFILYLLSKVLKNQLLSNHMSQLLIFEFPNVSVIVAAYNEEKVIARRIENLLEQDYPKDKMEIIIASDGSTDRTVKIAKKYENKGVRVLDFKKNRGRAAVHNNAVDVAKGEILLFTDAETIFEKDFIKNLVRNYTNQRIGCVVGKLIYINSLDSAISSSESFYFKYEVFIRALESKLGILCAASGAAMSCRKIIYEPIEQSGDIDVVIPLLSISKGYQNCLEANAIAYEISPSSISQELKYRIRDVALSLSGTLRMLENNFFKFITHPEVLLSLVTHRILRWLTPVLLLILLSSNFILVGQTSLYNVTFTIQLVFYAAGIAGLFLYLVDNPLPIISTIFSFLIANIGILGGIVKFVMGKASSAYTE